MIVKNAMMLCVGCKDWFKPKHILVETDIKDGERLSTAAERAFKKYKKTQSEDILHVNYTYYGDVEIVLDKGD